VAARVRRDRDVLLDLLDAPPAALLARSERLRALLRPELRDPEVVGSLAHLHVNRLLRDDHRAREAEVLDALGLLLRRRAQVPSR
jgi:hypothetical protein